MLEITVKKDKIGNKKKERREGKKGRKIGKYNNLSKFQVLPQVLKFLGSPPLDSTKHPALHTNNTCFHHHTTPWHGALSHFSPCREGEHHHAVEPSTVPRKPHGLSQLVFYSCHRLNQCDSHLLFNY